MRGAQGQLALDGQKRILLAALEGQRRLRAIRADERLERWVRAWARRWYIVTAPTVRTARAAVALYLDDCSAVPLADAPKASAYGILESGHNAPGGPRRLPEHTEERTVLRPTPASRRRHPALARGPTRKGTSLI